MVSSEKNICVFFSKSRCPKKCFRKGPPNTNFYFRKGPLNTKFNNYAGKSGSKSNENLFYPENKKMITTKILIVVWGYFSLKPLLAPVIEKGNY